MTKEKTSNITEHDRAEMNRMFNGEKAMALYSCFYKGQPAVALVEVKRVEGDKVCIYPMYLKITDEMAKDIVDHDGRVPKRT